MRKVLRVGAIVGAFALTAWIGVVALAQSGTPSPSPTTTSTTTTATTTSPGVGDGDQFKGPCDEAEHANDPECEGATLVPEDNEANDVTDDQGENEGNDDDGQDLNDDQGENEDGDDNSGPGENSGSGSDDSGQRGNPVEDLLPSLHEVRTDIASRSGKVVLNRNREDAVRVEPGIDRAQRQETSRHEPGGNHQRDGQRDLRDDECVAQPRAAAHLTTSSAEPLSSTR